VERDAAAVPVWNALGGYRLLRTIGRGSDGVAYLATGDGAQVVVKAYDDGVDRDRIANEIGALCAVDSPHVVAVIDVSMTQREPVALVLERLSSRTLADWLRERTVLDTGEVVTAAVSVVRAVRAVHECGFVHGRVSGARIRFDDAGCPVLLGFGGARAATHAGLADDWERCVAIVESIVARAETIEPDEASQVLAVVRRLREPVESGEAAVADAVESALFGLGPPAPLLMAGERHAAPVDPPSTALALEPMFAGTETGETTTAQGSSGTSHHRRDGLLAGFTAVAAGAMEHGVGAVIAGRVRGVVSGRRRTVVVGVSIAAGLTMVALLTMPSAPAGHAEGPSPSTTPRAAAERDAGGRSTSTTAGTAIPATVRPATTATPDPEDPVHAAFRLLRDRRSCLEHGDGGCLVAIDQADSPLFAADSALLSARRGTTVSPELSQLSLTETVGDAVVISIAASETTKPASVLVIKTEAGWRLRALFEN
jgi:tRNA A-37 threonylcarbamoyl transferase component Bud32